MTACFASSDCSVVFLTTHRGCNDKRHACDFPGAIIFRVRIWIDMANPESTAATALHLFSAEISHNQTIKTRRSGITKESSLKYTGTKKGRSRKISLCSCAKTAHYRKIVILCPAFCKFLIMPLNHSSKNTHLTTPQHCADRRWPGRDDNRTSQPVQLSDIVPREIVSRSGPA